MGLVESIAVFVATLYRHVVGLVELLVASLCSEVDMGRRAVVFA